VQAGLPVHVQPRGQEEVEGRLQQGRADTPAHLWPIAKMSLEAHLAKLERDGRVRRKDDLYVAVLG
jgi:ribonuclease/clavin/mitogillin